MNDRKFLRFIIERYNYLTIKTNLMGGLVIKFGIKV